MVVNKLNWPTARVMHKLNNALIMSAVATPAPLAAHNEALRVRIHRLSSGVDRRVCVCLRK